MSGKGHETRDIPPRGAALALGGVLAMLLVVGAIVAALLGWIGSHHPPLAPIKPAPAPAPQLQVAALPERARIEAAALARLRGDAEHPSIDEAMHLVAAEGWHDQAPPPPAAEAASDHVGAGG